MDPELGGRRGGDGRVGLVWMKEGESKALAFVEGKVAGERNKGGWMAEGVCRRIRRNDAG